MLPTGRNRRELCKLLHAGDVGGEEVDAASVEVSAGAVVVLIGARAGVARNDAPSATACKFVGRAILSEAEGDLDVAGHWYARAADAWTALPRPYDALLARERRGRSELTSAARVESLGPRRSRKGSARTRRALGCRQSRPGAASTRCRSHSNLAAGTEGVRRQLVAARAGGR